MIVVEILTNRIDLEQFIKSNFIGRGICGNVGLAAVEDVFFILHWLKTISTCLSGNFQVRHTSKLKLVLDRRIFIDNIVLEILFVRGD